MIDHPPAMSLLSSFIARDTRLAMSRRRMKIREGGERGGGDGGKEGNCVLLPRASR